MTRRCPCGRFKKDAEAARIRRETLTCLVNDVNGVEYVPPKRFRPVEEPDEQERKRFRSAHYWQTGELEAV